MRLGALLFWEVGKLHSQGSERSRALAQVTQRVRGLRAPFPPGWLLPGAGHGGAQARWLLRGTLTMLQGLALTATEEDSETHVTQTGFSSGAGPLMDL